MTAPFAAASISDMLIQNNPVTFGELRAHNRVWPDKRTARV
jgi:hypothetical protein